MRILSKDFPTSLFHSTAPGWVQTSVQQPQPTTIAIAYNLKNFLLWLIFINIVNHYTLNFKIYFGEVDVVSLLSNPPQPLDDSNHLAQNLEDILRGIYVRNEAMYLANINETTIVAKPVFVCNDNSVLAILREGFFAGTDGKFKVKTGTSVLSQVTERFPYMFTVFHLKAHIDIVQRFLEIFLVRLYTETGLDIASVVKKVKDVIAPVTIGKFGVLINSGVLFVLYVVFHCAPKVLVWHYVNLALLYVINTANIAFILMILISKSQLRDFSNDFSYCLLIIEFVSFIAVMVLFFNDHKVIIRRQALLPYSCPSSVYSERNSKVGEAAKPDEPQLQTHTADRNASNQQSPKPLLATHLSPQHREQEQQQPQQQRLPPLHHLQLPPQHQPSPPPSHHQQQQPTKTFQPHKGESFPVQRLQEQYATPVPLTTGVASDQLQQQSAHARSPERRCVTVPVNLPRKLEPLHHTPAAHPGHLPNLQL
ncbi:hypothetical protein Cantr_03817 [Candida viswanathii]|uniref:Uncharacterized protein n=1 Tax=Candida viswanathii TaxID=5486 RepID=A0A367XNT0_9ASCO|nr:hypothetical protein Cantr_03817 [Candida viswanathii]